MSLMLSDRRSFCWMSVFFSIHAYEERGIHGAEQKKQRRRRKENDGKQRPQSLWTHTQSQPDSMIFKATRWCNVLFAAGILWSDGMAHSSWIMSQRPILPSHWRRWKPRSCLMFILFFAMICKPGCLLLPMLSLSVCFVCVFVRKCKGLLLLLLAVAGEIEREWNLAKEYNYSTSPHIGGSSPCVCLTI